MITVELVGKLTAPERDELAAEVERLAPFRGAERAELVKCPVPTRMWRNW